MKRRTLLLTIVAACCLTGLAPGQTREIIGYYPSWKWRTDKNLLTPEKIPFRNLTTINYAFFFPLPDGTIVGRDSIGDAMILQGLPGPARDHKGSRLTDLAHRNGVKVLLSIGGWEESGNFPLVAGDPARRARFARACIERVVEFGFDGIDIDWEYPGFSDHNGTPADRGNFTLLLQAVRDSLDRYGAENGRHLLLTAAIPTDPGRTSRDMDIARIAPILDFLNIMTYDFYGPWDPRSNHNSPLYAGEGGDSTRCVDGAFTLFHTIYGVPPSKLTIGVPFYGHTYTHCTALNTAHGGADTVHFPREGAFYWTIAQGMANFDRFWDDRAKVPYLVSASWNMFVSYDDEESVRYKGEYAVEKGLNGIIIWEISGDYMPDGRSPLLEVLSTTLRAAQSPRSH